MKLCFFVNLLPELFDFFIGNKNLVKLLQNIRQINIIPCLFLSKIYLI